MKNVFLSLRGFVAAEKGDRIAYIESVRKTCHEKLTSVKNIFQSC